MESCKEKFDEQDQLAQYLATPIGIILAVKTLQAKFGRDKRGSHENTIQKGKGTKAYASAHPPTVAQKVQMVPNTQQAPFPIRIAITPWQNWL